jgi:GMP synthase (glutamine-hydrolysing)
MALPRLLILKTGSTAPQVVHEWGDYEAWFIRTIGSPDRFTVVAPVQGERLPDVSLFDGVLVTGSPLSVCQPEPWMKELAATLLDWSLAGRAVLGVCFGHQLLSHAAGTPVIRNPNGREMGTVEVTLTAEGLRDPLFAGLDGTVRIQTTHSDIASGLPAGTTLLATNANTAVQAATFGPRARGVQFHPEISAPTMRSMIHARREILAAEGIDATLRSAAVTETSAGAAILRNFEERFVRQ